MPSPSAALGRRAVLSEVHPVLMVRDVAASVAFYERLGFRLRFRDSDEAPRYAGVRRDGVELHLQWHDASAWAHPGDRPTYRILVADVDALSDEWGAEPGGADDDGAPGAAPRRGEPGARDRVGELDRTPVMDTAWGTREFHLRDPDGNGLQLYRDA